MFWANFDISSEIKEITSAPYSLIIFLCVISILSPSVIQGQGENNTWYFSQGLGIDFNTSPPELLTGGGMNTTIESSATICDSLGNLLYYSDGLSVWNRNHETLPNGSGLTGHFSSAQSPHFIQCTDTDSIFLLYSNTGEGIFYYSVIDQTLDNGLGDISNIKNVPFLSNIAEMSITVPAPCGEFWLITHTRLSDEYIVVKFSKEGIEEVRNISMGNVFVNSDPTNNISSRQGRMAVNDTYNMICLTNQSGDIHLLDFENVSGELSNLRILKTERQDDKISGAQSPVFSPNGAFLYVIEGRTDPLETFIYQYDLSLEIIDSIQESKTLIARVDQERQQFSNMVLAPDGRIYVTRRNRSFLGVIETANNKSPLVNYISDGFSLGGVIKNSLSLQNLTIATITSVDYKSVLPKDTFLCNSQPLLIEIDSSSNNFTWENNSNEILITEPGVYRYSFDINDCLFNDSILVENLEWTIDLGNDTIICSGDEIILDSGINDQPVLWQDGSTAGNYTVETSGVFIAEYLDSSGCATTDTIVITEVDCDIQSIYIPTIFSPNNDGTNDFFQITFHPQKPSEYLLTIYDRWGIPIFTSDDLNRMWDGKINSENAPSGIYVYYIQYTTSSGRAENRVGSITLLR